jgi:hypothetical protein
MPWQPCYDCCPVKVNCCQSYPTYPGGVPIELHGCVYVGGWEQTVTFGCCSATGYPSGIPVKLTYRKLRKYPITLTRGLCPPNARPYWYGSAQIGGWDAHGACFAGDSTLEVLVYCSETGFFGAWVADSSKGGVIMDLCAHHPGPPNEIPGNYPMSLSGVVGGAPGNESMCKGCAYLTKDFTLEGQGGPPMTANSAVAFEVFCGPNCHHYDFALAQVCDMPTSIHGALSSGGCACLNGFQFDMQLVYVGYPGSAGRLWDFFKQYIGDAPWPCISATDGSAPYKRGLSLLDCRSTLPAFNVSLYSPRYPFSIAGLEDCATSRSPLTAPGAANTTAASARPLTVSIGGQVRTGAVGEVNSQCPAYGTAWSGILVGDS